MPDPRPLSSLRSSDFDSPPASSAASSSYPNRHARLRQALRNTNALARDASRSGRRDYSPAIESQRSTSMGLLRRTRRRLRASSDNESSADATEERSEGRSAKRRRIGNESPLTTRKPHKYGHHGQVESGRLRMEIISNDGGQRQDSRNPGVFLGAENMLKNDKSVFCSERTSAGILLRHEDETSFCLDKLYIVGPEHGFTAPVREGVVYTAMDIKDLRMYQDPPHYARRSGLHEQPLDRYRGIQASPEQLTLSDALRDPEIATAADRGISPFPRDGTEEPAEDEPTFGQHIYEQLGYDTHCDIPSPPEETVQREAPSENTSFTLLSDEESGPEDITPQEMLDYRLQRLRRMRRSHRDMDDWEPDDPTLSYSRANGAVNRRNGTIAESFHAPPNGRLAELMARARPYLSPSPDAPDAPDQSGMQRTKTPQPAADDPNVQAARFSIKRGKSRVAVKFDPPVSARYMLLKLWAGKSNVDVQSVIVKGFAGPRFFPAMELL